MCECGMEFEVPKILTNGGGDVGEDVDVCPYCGSESFDEAEPPEPPVTVDLALAYGEDRKVSVELNGCIAWMFSASDIEAILKSEMDKLERSSALVYCTDDFSDYRYWYERERSEGQQ